MPSSDLDFTLDTPERGADESPTREMPPRDEPTVESELMNFADSPTHRIAGAEDRRDADDRHSRSQRSKLPGKADQTAEVSIDDLGLDLDQLEDTGAPSANSIPPARGNRSSGRCADHGGRPRRPFAAHDGREAAKPHSRDDRDLTELERELEASFIADLDSRTRRDQDRGAAARVRADRADAAGADPTRDLAVQASPEFSDIRDPDKVDIDSTSKLRGINADSIDLDLDRLATALGSGDTVEQPRAAEEVFSTEVFEASQRSRRVDLDVGEAMNGAEHPTNKFAGARPTN